MRKVRTGRSDVVNGSTAAICMFATSLIVGCSPVASYEVAAAPECRAAQTLATLPAALHEVSGVTRDPRRADVFWMHNDGGNAPVLFAVDTAGRIVGQAWIRNIRAKDAEDLALGRCSGGWCLYLADIGDNRAERGQVAIYRIPLPDLPARAGGSKAEEETAGEESSIDVFADRTYRLTYPDGARDAEALFVDDRRTEIVVISKGREGSAIAYTAPLEATDADSASRLGPVMLRRLGPLPVPIDPFTGQLITAADLSPDGRWIAVRSYSTLYFLRWSGSVRYDSTAKAPAYSLLGALEPLGEGIAFSDSSDWLYLTSERGVGNGPQFDRIWCWQKRGAESR